MITIKKDHLKALLNASSTDKMRYNINSIHFDTIKKIAEATNGHMLFSFPIAIEGEEKSIIFSADSLNRLLKVCPKEMTHIGIEDRKYMGMKLDVIVTNFPDTSAVIPSLENCSHHVVSLGATVLEKLVKIAKESEKEFSKTPVITFSFPADSIRPVIVETTSGTGVIMPMRGPVRERKVA